MPADRVILFISHSSHTPADQTFVETLRQKLETHPDGRATGLTVFLDRDHLKAGDTWNDRLDDALVECHGAVLILTRHSIQRPWVLKESTIVSWRHALDPHFKLFPMLWDDVTPADLDNANFAPLFLDKIQHVAAGCTADDVAGQVLAGMQETLADAARPKTPLESLAQDLAVRFQRADIGILKEILEELGVAEPAWEPGMEKKALIANLVTRQVVRDDFGAMEGLDELIDFLRRSGLNAEDRVQVLEMLAPLWVDAAAAGKLPELIQRPGRWAAALNGQHAAPYTARMYVRRAYPLSRRWTLLPVHGGESEARLEELERRIRDAVRVDRNDPAASDAAIDAYLDRRRNPYFVLLPPPHPDKDVLRALQTTFETVTFLLHTGPELPHQSAMPDQVEMLSPPLDLDLENTRFGIHEDALDIASGR